MLSINIILYFGLGFGTSKEDTAKRFFLELKVQRTVLAGTELTIRYNSVFEVRKGKILPLGKGTFYNNSYITTLTRFWRLLTTTSNYFAVKGGIPHTIDISSTTYQPRLINIVPVKKVPFEISLKGKVGQTLQKIQIIRIFTKCHFLNSGSLV